MSWNKQRYVKNIPNIINCDLKKDWQIIIIFGANMFYTTCHQTTVRFPTSPNVCFCTTWKTPNRRNRIKMQYFVGFVSPGNRETNNGCGEKLNYYLIVSCQKYWCQKLLKLNYNRKCPRCFFSRHSVLQLGKKHNHCSMVWSGNKLTQHTLRLRNSARSSIGVSR